MYGFVYITTNHINGKKYIGQKKYDKQGKWKEYLGSGIILSKAIQKYGKENFSKQIIEECVSKQYLNEREKYWIKFYNATENENFYNIADGGDGGNTISGYSSDELERYKEFKSVLHKITAPKGEKAPNSKLTNVQVLTIIELLKENRHVSEIADRFSVSPTTISDIYMHRTWKELTEDIMFPKQKHIHRKTNTKQVVQYDLQGNVINEYSSAREAERQTGIGYRQISQVCNGEKRIAHNYIWRFKCDPFEKYETENTHAVKIDQYDKNGIYIQTFDSIKDADKCVGISCIESVINGRSKSAGGFFWCKHGDMFIMPEYERNIMSA